MSDFLNDELEFEEDEELETDEDLGDDTDSEELDDEEGKEEGKKAKEKQVDINKIVQKRVKREKEKTAKVQAELTSLKSKLAKLTDIDLSSLGIQTGKNSAPNNSNTNTNSQSTTLGEIFKQLGIQTDENKSDDVSAIVKKFAMKDMKNTVKAHAKELGVKKELVDDLLDLCKLHKVEIDSDGDYDEDELLELVEGVIARRKDYFLPKKKKTPLTSTGQKTNTSSGKRKTLAEIRAEKYAKLRNEK